VGRDVISQARRTGQASERQDGPGEGLESRNKRTQVDRPGEKRRDGLGTELDRPGEGQDGLWRGLD
jgi:hypothetical protein